MARVCPSLALVTNTIWKFLHTRECRHDPSAQWLQGVPSGIPSPTIANKRGMFPTGRVWIIVSSSNYLWEFLLNHNLIKVVSIKIWASFMLHKVPESSRRVGDVNTAITLLCSLLTIYSLGMSGWIFFSISKISSWFCSVLLLFFCLRTSWSLVKS